MGTLYPRAMAVLQHCEDKHLVRHKYWELLTDHDRGLLEQMLELASQANSGVDVKPAMFLASAFYDWAWDAFPSPEQKKVPIYDERRAEASEMAKAAGLEMVLDTNVPDGVNGLLLNGKIRVHPHVDPVPVVQYYVGLKSRESP